MRACYKSSVTTRRSRGHETLNYFRGVDPIRSRNVFISQSLVTSTPTKGLYYRKSSFALEGAPDRVHEDFCKKFFMHRAFRLVPKSKSDL